MKKICLDLDGTIYDLYHLDNWRSNLENEINGIFSASKTLIDLCALAEIANLLIESGYSFCVCSWLPMGASIDYENSCRAEKENWVAQNLPFISEVYIASYGTPKHTMVSKKSKEMILIDDSIEVCQSWDTPVQRRAYNVNEYYTVLNVLNEIYSNL